MRAVALPPEHGAWGFLAESLLVGLIAAPSPAAGAVAVAGIALFLLRHPFKIVLADRLVRGRFFPRTGQAAAFAAGYAAAAGAALLLAILWAPDARWMIPLALALPAGLVQLSAELRSQGRALLPELLGASSTGALAASCALASGWPSLPAWSLWGVLVLRSVPAIVYARTRIRLDRGMPAARGPAWALHAAALAIVLVFIPARLAPWASAAVFSVLLARALRALGPRRQPIRPQQLGRRELALGIGSALVLGLGYRLGL